MTQTEYINRIKNKAKDEEHRLSDDDWTEVLEEALKEYNQAHPNTAIADLSGNGTSFLNVPSDWDEEFSDLLRLEELDSEGRPEEIRRSRLTLELRPHDAPRLYRQLGYFSSGITYRLRYTLAHTIDADSSTVPSGESGALVSLAAAYACTRLAAAYAANIDPSMGGITIEQRAQTDKFRSLAKDYRAEYERATGSSKEGSRRPRGRMKTWKRDSPLLLHP